MRYLVTESYPANEKFPRGFSDSDEYETKKEAISAAADYKKRAAEFIAKWDGCVSVQDENGNGI